MWNLLALLPLTGMWAEFLRKDEPKKEHRKPNEWEQMTYEEFISLRNKNNRGEGEI